MSRPCGEIKESYLADMGFIQKRFHWVSLSIFLGFLFTLPYYGDPYILSLLGLICVFSVSLMGLNLITEAGLFSVATAALMGIGGYSAGFLSYPPYSLPFYIVIPLAGIITMIVAATFALPALRIKVFYMVFLTLAMQFIIEWILVYIVKDVPGAVVYIKPMEIAGYKFGVIETYWIFLIITIIMGYLIAHLKRTPVGKAIVMIGEKDFAAELFGVNPLKYKMLAFAIYGFYAGVGGAMWAYRLGMVTAEHFYSPYSWEMLGMVIVGGIGSYVWGSILGAVVMIAIAQLITMLISAVGGTIPYIGLYIFGFKAILYGLVIALILIIEPHGFAALLRKVKRFFDLFPFSY